MSKMSKNQSDRQAKVFYPKSPNFEGAQKQRGQKSDKTTESSGEAAVKTSEQSMALSMASVDRKSTYAPMWLEQMYKNSGLFIVSTPIGHCEDITLRALETLKNVDGILCEDTRMTRTLLTHYGISQPCYSYHAHNESKKIPGIIHRLIQGDRLALVSDRGTPLISDPGSALVQKCYAENIPVHIIGGVSAVTHAVTGCGLPGNGFYFQGFMPAKKSAQQWKFLATLPTSLVFFIAPHDLLRFTKDALAALGPRSACLMRELTKKFEERVALPLDALVAWIERAPHLGECVMIITGKAFKKRVAVSKYTKDAPIIYENADENADENDPDEGGEQDLDGWSDGGSDKAQEQGREQDDTAPLLPHAHIRDAQ